MRSDDTEARAGTDGPPRQDERAVPADEPGGDEPGGDPACWLARVCPECGRLTEGRDPTRCAACGEPLP